MSDFGDGTNQGDDPIGVVVEASGNILVTDVGVSLLFRVDQSTGARTVLSDFSVGANQGVSPVGIAVYPVLPAPVGGVSTPINKLEILVPYLALIGLIAVATVIFTIGKRHKG